MGTIIISGATFVVRSYGRECQVWKRKNTLYTQIEEQCLSIARWGTNTYVKSQPLCGLGYELGLRHRLDSKVRVVLDIWSMKNGLSSLTDICFKYL